MRGAVDVVLQWQVGVGNRSIERDDVVARRMANATCCA